MITQGLHRGMALSYFTFVILHDTNLEVLIVCKI